MTGDKGSGSRRASGWVSGFIGVAIFSGSLPATRVAVGDFDPVFLTLARAAIAGLCAVMLLLAERRPRPRRADLASLAVVALGVVIGFPLLTAFALKHVTSAHATLYIGLLPLSTALFGVLRGAERPRPAFWLFAGAGSVAVAAFALHASASGSAVGDGLMLAAIVICGLGYAEGARLARSLGGGPVICWALVLTLPVALPVTVALWPYGQPVGVPALLGLAYVSIFSMLVGFLFWYRGLALGGIAAVGQLQLLQPFMSLALAALLLGETVGRDVVLVAGLVALCVAGAKRVSGPGRPATAGVERSPVTR